MWWRRKWHVEVKPNPEAQRRLDEARQAHREVDQQLAEVCEQWPEVREEVARSRRALERNGFAEMFRRAVRGTSDPSAG